MLEQLEHAVKENKQLMQDTTRKQMSIHGIYDEGVSMANSVRAF